MGTQKAGASTPKAATTPRTTVVVDTVLGAGANNFKKALNEIMSGVDQIKGLEAKVDELDLKIGNKLAEIEQLNVDFTEKKRTYIVDFDLEVKKNAEDFVMEWLHSNGKVAALEVDLEATRTELADLKANMEDKISGEVKRAVAIAQNQAANDAKLAKSEFERAEAGNIAEINQLKLSVSMYKEQAETWKNALDAERTAGVERARAGAIGTINLAGGNGK